MQATSLSTVTQQLKPRLAKNFAVIGADSD